MDNLIDLTEGSIIKKLSKMAFPIMMTSLFQMAYNLTDMIWLGRVGSRAVAAAGTAGFFMWLASSLVMITKIGSETTVSRSIGKKDYAKVQDFIRTNIFTAAVIGIIYSVFIALFASNLLTFFKFDEEIIYVMASDYLRIISAGFLFSFLTPTFSGIYNGMGNSRTPFLVNTIGLAFNIVLDPVLIIILKLGVRGAALATVFSQLIVFLVFLFLFNTKIKKLFNMKFFVKIKIKDLYEVFKIGFPVTLQNGAFCIFSMILTRMVSYYGAVPVAVQSVGSQIESLSWMTAGGFSTALGSFTGQNFGAGKFHRIIKGYRTTLFISFVIGAGVTFVFIAFGGPVFSFFLPETDALEYGIIYLKILAVSQMFMMSEITTQGVFNGLGNTFPPSFVSIVFTGLRIPFAIFLSYFFIKDVTSVWWAVSISSIFKGIVLPVWFKFYYSRKLTGLPEISKDTDC